MKPSSIISTKAITIALGIFSLTAFVSYEAISISGANFLQSTPYYTRNVTADTTLARLTNGSGAAILDTVVAKVKAKAYAKAGTPFNTRTYNAYLDAYLAKVDQLDNQVHRDLGSDYEFLFQYIYPRVYELRATDNNVADIIKQIGNIDSSVTITTTPVAPTCAGTAPTGNGVIKSTTAFGGIGMVGSDTWRYINNIKGTTSTDLGEACQWTCIPGYTKSGNTCTVTTPTTPVAVVNPTTPTPQESPKECTGTMPTLGDGMQANYYNGITAGPATPNTTWKFSTVADSCTVSCKTGYKRDGSKESCIKKPDYGTLAVTVYGADGNIAKSSGNSSITVECYSPSKMKQMGAYMYSGYYPFWSTSNGVANIYPSRCAEEGDDAIIFAKYGSVIGKSVTVAEIMKTPSLSLNAGKEYSFSYSNPYLARVLISVTGLGANAKMCAGGVGACQDASKYVVPPSPWVYDGNSDTWSFSQDVDWDKAGTEYFDFGMMKDGKILKVESIHYTGYPTNNRPGTEASGYCPNGQTVAGPCTGTDVTIDNNSSNGHLRLVVHTPTKSGWKGCASPGSCTNLASDYSSAQSAYENNSAWSWNESAKTWSCDIYWPELPNGTYSIGVANDRYVFKTISINWTK